MTIALLFYNSKLYFLIFITGLHSSLIVFIWTNTVSYRNALDRLCVRLKIILLRYSNCFTAMISYMSDNVLVGHAGRYWLDVMAASCSIVKVLTQQSILAFSPAVKR